MLISIDKSFKIGDYVTIQNISGTVEEIGLLTTKVINDEGKKVHIPNQLIFAAPFINITASSTRKIIINLEIRNSEKINETRELIEKELQGSEIIMDPEKVEVVVTSQKIDHYNLQVKFWTKQKHISKVRGEVILLLKKKLDQVGVSMTTID